MKGRWLPVGVLAGVLFVVNVIARLVTRFAFHARPEVQDRVSLVMFGVIGLILAAVAARWGGRSPVAQWGPELAAAVLVALALTVFVGPFVSGSRPFADGAGEFFSQIWLYAGFAGAGALLGYLVLTAFGLDYRSQSLKRYTEVKQAKPRRVVRR
ncbi:MAG TPA: hypothetical protein VF462_11670 [Micromonosporaceae bacterium]